MIFQRGYHYLGSVVFYSNTLCYVRDAGSSAG